MNLFPVAARELKLLAGQPRTYRGRVLSALTVALVGLSMLYAGFAGAFSAASAGSALFLTLACLAAAYVLLDGVVLTADCLSQEKRDGTLGLLFLTDLRGYDIVLGKLVSRVATPVYCVLAALPALGIGLFLGGVSGLQFCHMALALLNGLFLSAAWGMFVSAVSRRERQALSAALFGMLTVAVLIPLLGWGLSVYRLAPAIDPIFLVASPAGCFLFSILEGSPGVSLGFTFQESLGLCHLLGWGLLASASVLLPHSWREQVAGEKPITRWRAWRKTRSLRHRSGAFEDNPVLWAGERPGERGLGFWVVLLVFGLSWGLGWLFARSQWWSLFVYVLAMASLHLCLVFALLVQACRRPGQDVRSGVLEILLTTPRGDDIYLRGRMLLLKRQCFGPVLIVLAMDFGLMAAGCWQSGTLNWEWLGWIGACVAFGLKLLVDLYVVSWVGLWQGLKAGSTGRALRNTVFCLFLVRWVLLLAVLALFGVITEGRLFQSAAGGLVGSAAYLVFFLMTALHYCGVAVGELQDSLRLLALRSAGGRDEPAAPGRELLRHISCLAGINLETLNRPNAEPS